MNGELTHGLGMGSALRYRGSVGVGGVSMISTASTSYASTSDIVSGPFLSSNNAIIPNLHLTSAAGPDYSLQNRKAMQFMYRADWVSIIQTTPVAYNAHTRSPSARSVLGPCRPAEVESACRIAERHPSLIW